MGLPEIRRLAERSILGHAADRMPIMRWQAATFIFLAYLGATALLRPRLARLTRTRTLVAVLAGAAVTFFSVALPGRGFFNTWLLPPALLFTCYWTSGLLFVAPMPSLERGLCRIDERLRIEAVSRRLPQPVVELLELAYAGVYPLIPIALYFALAQGVDADRFWTMIVVTDYVCFGMLPWFQTRPPRALGSPAPWRSRFRIVNQRMLDASSVQVNTFPSGHAAEALAAALLVSGGPAPLVAWMFFNAMAISAGAVFGRYHYAADALVGWVVAIIVWLYIP